MIAPQRIPFIALLLLLSMARNEFPSSVFDSAWPKSLPGLLLCHAASIPAATGLQSDQQDVIDHANETVNVTNSKNNQENDIVAQTMQQEGATGSQQNQDEVVYILVELQKQVDAQTGHNHTREEEATVDQFLEGDIVLTLEQAQELLLDVQPPRRRKKRKLAEPISKRWTLPIPFAFDGSHSEVEKRRIKDALSYWEDLTCITFDENTSAEFKLLFSRQRGCWSYVGYTRQTNQTISIGDGCESNGTIAHEIGHAVGFWHEQSRPDRHLYVVIHEDNITQGKIYNFQTRTWGEIVILNVPYDLGSGMHYGAKFYAKDLNGSLTTVETRDPLMMRVIGQRQELSFYDVKLANKAYCDDICTSYGIQLPQPCKRDGYQDPKNCWRCRCPDGFGGNYCETVHPSVNSYCGGVLDAKYNGTIYSPGYLSPGYRSDVQCSWLIKAPGNYNVYLEFVDSFGITGHVDVCKDFVEVRYNTSLALTGARFCCLDPPKGALKSDTNEMLVLFRSFEESRTCDDTKFPWKCITTNVGFKARFYTRTCGGCGSPLARTVQPACTKRVSYTCAQTWEDQVKIDCPKWWQSNSCGTRTVSRIRYATCYHDQPYCCDNYQLDANLCIASSNQIENNKIFPVTGIDGPMSADRPEWSATVPSATPVPLNSILSQPVWVPWSQWGNCSRICGGGVMVRTRRCAVPGSCGSTNLQVDKRQCSQQPCYSKCPVQKQILCDLWTTCFKTVYELCNPVCFDGFRLTNGSCVWSGGAT